MKLFLPSVFALAGLLASSGLGAPAARQDPPAAPRAEPLDFAGLRAMVVNLGYEPNDITESKFEIKIAKEDYDVPVAMEISGSGNYIWLSAYLGDVPEDGLEGGKATSLLRRNFETQPSHFYITTKGSLMMALPVENRAIDPTILRRALDKITEDVVSSDELWSG